MASIQERFESKYIPEPNSGCWLWTGHLVDGRYGRLRIDRETMALAHRVSWWLYRGAAPIGIQVCHHCDTPSCVNPDHLFLGTQQDNMLDAFRKHRVKVPALRGQSHPSSKLVENQIVAIREDRRTLREISTDYSVSPSLICMIKSRKIWRHL